MNTKILSTGYYVPKNILTNQMLEEIVETNDEWITSRTGIKERRIVDKENTTDLAFNAATDALKNAGVEAEEIDLIIVATFSPANYSPSTSSILQARLGLNDKNVMAFDINAACTGFVYALDVANVLMKSNRFNKAIVVGAEVISKHTDWTDRNTCVLFGDGAGAVILGKTEENGIIETFCNSQGDVDHHLVVHGIPLNSPFYKAEDKASTIYMNGREVFKFAVRVMRESIVKLLDDNNLTVEDIDYIIPHQANLRIISNVSSALNIPIDKFYTNLENYGNTSAASIPIALAEANKLGKINKGDKIIIVGFGGGFTYASALIEF